MAAGDNQDALERQLHLARETFLKQHEEKHEDEKDRVDAWRVTHTAQHESEQDAIDLALDGERHRLAAHREAHDAAHAAHEKLHEARDGAHADRHTAEQRAVEAAVASMDKRLEGMNEFRESLRDQSQAFARKDAMDALDSQQERRYEELRTLIATEREERRATEGVKRGVSSSTAVIVAAIGVVGTVLGIIVVVLNLATGTP